MNDRALILLALLGLGACATTTAPVAVTRFSLNRDVARGPVAPADGINSLEQGEIDRTVERALGQAGFPAARQGDARYVYSASLERRDREMRRGGSPVSVGLAGATGGYGGGVGLGVSFGLGGRRSGPLVASRLSVQLRDRGTGQVVWEGRAESDTLRPDGSDVDRLAFALFTDFPGESGRTIRVR